MQRSRRQTANSDGLQRQSPTTIDHVTKDAPAKPSGAAKRAKADNSPASESLSAGAHRVKREIGWSGRLLRTAWIMLGVVVLGVGGWIGWLLVGTNQLAASNARDVASSYLDSCSAGAASPSPDGQVLGMLSLPGLSDREWPIMAGISDDDLASGIGWYPQTAGVGEIGNMVLVGYRLTHGAPFAQLLEMDAGDQVKITTCTHVYNYEITVAPRELTVQAGDDWVLDAVPGSPGQQPTGRMITLVTSQDLLATSDRSVGFGTLTSSQPR